MALFEALAAMSASAHLIQVFGATVVRAHVSAAGVKGAGTHALGRSRGGFTKKIHAKSDASDDIIAFDLTAGEAADAPHIELLDIGPNIRPRAAICDEGYVGKVNRAAARARGMPVIPHKFYEKDKPKFSLRRSAKPTLVFERGMRRIKRFETVVRRSEKTARNIRSIVSFAAERCLIKILPHGLSPWLASDCLGFVRVLRLHDAE